MIDDAANLERMRERRNTQVPLHMGTLTTRIQFLGLHSQVIPGIDFSVQFFLIVNVPLLGYSEELAFVTGPADGVSAQGRERFQTCHCSLLSSNSQCGR